MKERKNLKDIKYYLEDTLHYSAHTVKAVMESVEALDEVTFRDLVNWREEGIFPEEPVEGVTVRELVEKLGLEPVNAFITFGWLKSKPEEAKYTLMRPWHDLELSEEIRRKFLGETDNE